MKQRTLVIIVLSIVVISIIGYVAWSYDVLVLEEERLGSLEIE